MKDSAKGLVTILILVAIITLFVFYIFNTESPGTTVQHTGTGVFEIQKLNDNSGYRIKIYVNNNANPYFIITRYSPDQVKDINIENLKPYILSKKEGFITIDPNADLKGKTTIAALEIDKIMDNGFLFNMPISSAFTVPFNNNTVMTCEDADDETNVFWLRLGDTSNIFRQDNCIIIQGETEEDLIMLADRLMFHLLGIVP